MTAGSRKAGPVSRIAAEATATMAEVRAGVDAVDRELVTLLAERMAYMDAAARIKPLRGQVRDEARKALVIANVRAHAAALGLDADLAEGLWEQLIEASIAHELQQWDRMRSQVAAQ